MVILQVCNVMGNNYFVQVTPASQKLNDAEQFRTVREAMKVIEIGDDEQREIFEIVASVLHLGNVKFVQNDKGYAEILTHDTNSTNVAEVPAINVILNKQKLFFFFCFSFVDSFKTQLRNLKHCSKIICTVDIY